MLSSTSSSSATSSGSDRPRLLRASGVLLGALVVVAAGLELAAGTVGVRSSRILSRMNTEHKSLLGFASSAAHPKTVMILGNSLLVEGVDYPAMQKDLSAAGWESRRFVVEQTGYYDWKFGLRRLTSEGCRPDAIVLMLSATQFALNSYAGPAFAYNLMRATDVVEVMQTTGIHPTEAASLLLARESNFFGLRLEFRKHLLFALVPGMNDLVPHLTAAGKPSPHAFVRTQVLRRLPELVGEAASLGQHLILAIPPVAGGDDYAADVIEGGRLTGLPVLYPIRTGDLAADQFQDGFHLNASGAQVFTKALTSALLQQLNSMRP